MDIKNPGFAAGLLKEKPTSTFPVEPPHEGLRLPTVDKPLPPTANRHPSGTSPIVMNYLADVALPLEKRTKIAEALNSGDLTEQDAIAGITNKYGHKYGVALPTGRGIAGGIGKVGSGDDMPSNPMGGMMEPVETEKFLGQDSIKVPAQPIGDMAEKKTPGMTSPAFGSNLQNLPNPTLKDVTDIPANIYEQAKEGTGKIYKAGSNIGYAITGVGEHGEQLSPDERAVLFGKSLIDIPAGTLQTIFSPATATVGQLPGIKQATEIGMDGLKQGTDFLAHQYMQATGIDPESEQGRALSDGMNVLGQLLLAHAGEEGVKTKLSEASKTKILDEYNAAKVAGDTTKMEEALAKYEKAAGKKPSMLGTAMNLPGRGVSAITGAAGDLFKKFTEMAKKKPKAIENESVGIPESTQPAEKPLTPDQIDIERRARHQGYSDADLNTLRKLTPEQADVAETYFDHAMKRKQDIATTPRVWTIPAKEIENFVKDSHKQLSEIGRNMEEAIKTDLKGKPVDASKIALALEGALGDMNIRRNAKGKLDFSGSDIALNPTAQKALKIIDQNLKANATYSLKDLGDYSLAKDTTGGIYNVQNFKGGGTRPWGIPAGSKAEATKIWREIKDLGEVDELISEDWKWDANNVGLLKHPDNETDWYDPKTDTFHYDEPRPKKTPAPKGKPKDITGAPRIDARGLVSINRIINEATGVSKKAGFSANSLSSALGPIKDAVEETATPHSSLYATAKSEYASLKKKLDLIENAGHYGSGKNVGFSGKQILTRILNEGDSKYAAALQAVKDIEQNFGIAAPKDLQVKAYLANLVEKVTGTGAARGFGTQIKENAANAASREVITKGVDQVPVVGPAAATILRGAKRFATDANYKYLSGKVPGFKDAMAKADTVHVEVFLNLIKTPEFNELPVETKATILRQAAPSIPPEILSKVAKVSLLAIPATIGIGMATNNANPSNNKKP